MSLPQRYFSPEQIAAYLGCSAKTVRRMIASGELPARRLRNKAVRIDIHDADALLARIPNARGVA